MLDIFNALSDLVKSDLIQGHIGVIVIILLIIIALSCYLTWIVCTKIFLQIKLNQATDKEKKFAEMQTTIQELEDKNHALTEKLKKYDFEKALDCKATSVFEDSALERFKRRKK